MTIQDLQVPQGRVREKINTQTHQLGEFLFAPQSCKNKKRSII